MIKLIISRKDLVKSIDVTNWSKDEIIYTLCFYNKLGNGFDARVISDITLLNNLNKNNQ